MPTNSVSSPARILQILYRGPLESCNYGCAYCPFAKRRESTAAARDDRHALSRFVSWCGSLNELSTREATDDVSEAVPEFALELLFTPWGEALHRKRYQNAIVSLAGFDHVRFVGIQTNLSIVPQQFTNLSDAERKKITLWATWHPSETTMRAFVDRVRKTLELGVSASVGVVATREHLPLLATFRDALHETGSALQWVNAYKVGYRTPANYYHADDVRFLTGIDPWFEADLRGERSSSRPCETGTNAIAVDGNGDATRCHFVRRKLGNIYADSLTSIVTPPDTFRSCSRAECNCFQGYVHLIDTALHETFAGQSALSRRPALPT
jgi:hypothetical protein